MSNINITDWYSWVKAIPVGKRKSYIELPSFNVTGLTWKGASEIVLQYNFSAAGNFYLTKLPTKPTGVNYGLCIRYRVGETVFRYKLWDDTKFYLADTQIYAGQLIKKNFVLEVWSFEGETTAIQTTNIKIYTSPRQVPSDLRDTSDYSLATGAAFSALGNLGAQLPPSSSLLYRFAADTNVTKDGSNLVSAIKDADNRNITLSIGGANKPTWIAADAEVNNKPVLSFPTWAAGASYRLAATYVHTLGHFYAVCKLSAFDFADDALILSDKWYGLVYETGTPSVGFGRNNPSNIDLNFDPNLPNSEYRLLDITLSQLPNTVWVISGNLRYLNGNLVQNINNVIANPTGSGLLAIGNLNQFKFAEMLGYSTAQSGADVNLVLDYLKQKYGGAIGLPMTFNSGAAWLDNT